MSDSASERGLLRDSARRLLDTGSQLGRTRAARASWPEVDRKIWGEVCQAGWPMLLASEVDGGWGADASDMVAVLDGVADLLAPEPFAASLVVAPLLLACGTSSARAVLDDMVEGRSIALTALGETFPMAGDPTHVVAEAQWADRIVCADRTGEAFRLLAVEREELDQAWPARRTVDDGSLRFFSIEGVAGQELGLGPDIQGAFEAAGNLLRLGAAASLVGVAQRAFDMTLDYLKVRRQFGVPIGSFQALQHRAASMHVGCMAARALVREAALAVGTSNEGRACAMAKAKASAMAVGLVKECVQMHGAIGFTNEYDLALYFRRAVSLASSYGGADNCRQQVFDDTVQAFIKEQAA